MGDAWDVVSSLQDAVDAAKDAQGRKKIGFWRAAVAMTGVAWTVAGILPGVPAMISVNRWMKGKSPRPVVAMGMGLVVVTVMAGLLVLTPFVLVYPDDDAPALVGVLRAVLVGLAMLATLWFLGRYLFARHEDDAQVSPPAPAPAPAEPAVIEQERKPAGSAPGAG